MEKAAITLVCLWIACNGEESLLYTAWPCIVRQHRRLTYERECNVYITSQEHCVGDTVKERRLSLRDTIIAHTKGILIYIPIL